MDNKNGKKKQLHTFHKRTNANVWETSFQYRSSNTSQKWTAKLYPWNKSNKWQTNDNRFHPTTHPSIFYHWMQRTPCGRHIHGRRPETNLWNTRKHTNARTFAPLFKQESLTQQFKKAQNNLKELDIIFNQEQNMLHTAGKEVRENRRLLCQHAVNTKSTVLNTLFQTPLATLITYRAMGAKSTDALIRPRYDTLEYTLIDNKGKMPR